GGAGSVTVVLRLHNAGPPQPHTAGSSGTKTLCSLETTMKKTVLIATALVLVQVPLLALVLLQERTWGGPQFDEGSGVATAPDNSVYVTGTTLSFGAGDRDAFLLKYDANGAL